MRHAACAALVFAAAVFVPVGGFDEFLIGSAVIVAHQIAGALPAEDGVARNTPGRALKVDLSF